MAGTALARHFLPGIVFFKIGRVPTLRNPKGAEGKPPHAEENLMANGKFDMIGSSPACGKNRHNCAGQMDEEGIKHN